MNSVGSQWTAPYPTISPEEVSVSVVLPVSLPVSESSLLVPSSLQAVEGRDDEIPSTQKGRNGSTDLKTIRHSLGDGLPEGSG